MATRYRKRRFKQRSAEEDAKLLERIRNGHSNNDAAIVQAFAARGIEDVRPRENVLTYGGWQAAGRQVRKGQKGVKIDVYVEYEKKPENPEVEAENKRLARRTVTVFHVSQTTERDSDAPRRDTRPQSEKPQEEQTSPRPRTQSKPRRRGVTSQRLRTLADNMADKIANKLDPAIGRQNHTRRRASIAAGMRQEGYRLQEVQRARYKMADAIDAGTLPECLVGVYSEADLLAITYDWPSGHERANEHREARDWLQGVDREELQRQREARAEAERQRQIRDDILASPPDGFFPTPDSLADRMAEMLDAKPGHEILEPSAGMGSLVFACAKRYGESVSYLSVEQNHTLCEYLQRQGVEVLQADCLEVRGTVDRVVMNPPYEKKQDIRHVRHCYEMLNPGGKLVALISAGNEYRADKETVDFREWAKARASHWERLDDAFKGRESLRQTGVSVLLIVLEA